MAESKTAAKVDPVDVTDTVIESLTVDAGTPALDVDARSPAGNLASRSNIVASGPGSVGDFL